MALWRDGCDMADDEITVVHKAGRDLMVDALRKAASMIENGWLVESGGICIQPGDNRVTTTSDIVIVLPENRIQ